jgi:hypothetical protein
MEREPARRRQHTVGQPVDATLVATVNSQGSAESWTRRIDACGRQAARNVADTVSSATAQEPVSRKLWL